MDENVLDIYYIRHADAQNGVTDGRDACDRDITPLGEKQLELLTERFKGADIDFILSSPLVRCVKTAVAVANGIDNNIPVEIMPELIEKGSTPGYTGQSIGVLKPYYENLVLCKDNICSLSYTDSEKETKEQCLLRAKSVVEYIKNRFGLGKRIVVVSHGIFAINFYQSAMGICEEYGFRMTTDNTGVTKLQFCDDGVKRIVYHNDTTHLISLNAENKYRF